MTGSQTHGDNNRRETGGVDLRSLEGGSPEATTDAEAFEASVGSKSEFWDAAKSLTWTAAMGWVSGGYAEHNSRHTWGRICRAIGFGHLAAYSAEKAAESWPADRESATTNVATTIGTIVWAGGIGFGSNIAQTVGPAINCATNLTSAVLRYRQGKDGWARELVDAAEMAAFTAGGYTQHPVARAIAYSTAGAGFFWDALKSDKGFLGHAAGLIAWGAGAGMQNYSWQAAGAGAAALSEAARFARPYLEKTAASAPISVNSIANAASQLLPAPSGPTTAMAYDQTQPAPSSPALPPASSPALSAAFLPPPRPHSAPPGVISSATTVGPAQKTSTSRPTRRFSM